MEPNTTPKQCLGRKSNVVSSPPSLSLDRTPSISLASVRSDTARSPNPSPTKPFTGLEISNLLELRFEEFDNPLVTATNRVMLNTVRRQLALFNYSQRIIPATDRAYVWCLLLLEFPSQT